MYGELTCLGRHTVTGMLAASGNQFDDWSAAYRLFSKQHVDVSQIMNVVQSNVLQEADSLPYIVAHMDDTQKNREAHSWHCLEKGSAWTTLPYQFYLGSTIHPNVACSSA
jgi:hypothetical protein